MDLTDTEASAIQYINNGVSNLMSNGWELSYFHQSIERDVEYHFVNEFGEYKAGKCLKKKHVDNEVIVTLLNKKGKREVFIPKFHKSILQKDVAE